MSVVEASERLVARPRDEKRRLHRPLHDPIPPGGA